MSEITPEQPKRDHRNYFMRPLAFTDFNGNYYPDAIYHVDFERFKIEGKNITIAVTFYKSREDFDSGNLPISERDGGIRYITFRSEAFDCFIAANAEAVAAQALLLHSVVESQKTVPNPITGEMESFFKNAGEIIYPEAMKTNARRK